MYFFRQKKDNKGGINWSEVNRNGLHSLEVSLYYFRGQQHHILGITTGFVCMLSLFIT